MAGDPMKPATNRFSGGGDLLDDAATHHRDSVAEGHGLDLVVGDVDGRGGQALLQLRDGGAHLHPELGVEVRQRLVHEEGRGLPDDGPTHGDPLTLAPG
jgi:hypothetical protein